MRVRTGQSLTALLIAVAALGIAPTTAQAGSGYYYGAFGGMWDFLNDDAPGVEGGWVFGPKLGIYFISAGMALAVDLGGRVGFAGEDLDDWFVELPTLSVEWGGGFDGHFAFLGGGLSLAGLDSFAEDITVSFIDPYATTGLQIGFAGFVLRGEFQIGYDLRIGEPNFAWTTIGITLGYGMYTDFL